MLGFTDKQEKDIASLYWADSLTYLQISKIDRYKDLTPSKFTRITNKRCPYILPNKRKNPFHAFYNKPDDNSTYVDHLTDTELLQFEARRGCFEYPEF